MKTDPRPDQPTSFTWYALMSPNGEMAAPAANPETAANAVQSVYLTSLSAYVRVHGWRQTPDEPGLAVQAAAEQFAAFYSEASFVRVTSPDEAHAFRAWMVLAHLTADEALVRWRLAFPLPEGSDVDPLVEAFDAHREARSDDDDNEGGCSHVHA